MKKTHQLLVAVMLSILPFNLALAATPAENAFEELKQLKGEWQLKGESTKVTYELQSEGTILVETMEGMVTIYHLDGDSILMTHYCSMGNQPRTRATNFASPLKKLSFQFVDVSNSKPGQHFINGLTLEFISPNSLRQTWTSLGNEAQPMVFDLERVSK